MDALLDFVFILQKWLTAVGFVGALLLFTLLLAGWKLR